MIDELVQREKNLYDKIESLQKVMKKAYFNVAKEIANEMLALYQEISAGENILLSDLYKYDRYYKLLNDINDKLRKLGLKEIDILTDGMREMYISNQKIVGANLNFFGEVDENAIMQTINRVWVGDGLLYSDRVWNNKNTLANELVEGLINIIIKGEDYKKLSQYISDRFDVSYAKANRLVRTELKHIEIESTLNTYKDAGVKYYQYLTAQDDKVCDEPEYCECLDRKIFPIEDTTHLPPQHPNCRCSIRAYQEDFEYSN